MSADLYFGPGIHHLSESLVFEPNQIPHIYGAGMHKTVLVFDKATHGIVIDQSDPKMEQQDSCALDIHDLQIRYLNSMPQAPEPAIKIIGRGTENGIACAGSIRRVQFGHPDKTNEHPNTMTWLQLSGVCGLTVEECNFAQAYYSGISVEHLPLSKVFEPDGTSHIPRTLKTNIVRCNFAPGTHVAIDVERDTWVEGLMIEGCRIVGVDLGINLQSDGQLPQHGTHVIIKNNHIAHKRDGIIVENGAGVCIKDNYLLALPQGDFDDFCTHRHNDGEVAAHIRCSNVQLSEISGNKLGMVDPYNVPYGIILDGESDRVIVGPNFCQKTMGDFVKGQNVKRVRYIGEEWDA